MACFYLTRIDAFGQRHEMAGVWEAASAEAVVRRALALIGCEDDGCWQAHVVATEEEAPRTGTACRAGVR